MLKKVLSVIVLSSLVLSNVQASENEIANAMNTVDNEVASTVNGYENKIANAIDNLTDTMVKSKEYDNELVELNTDIEKLNNDNAMLRKQLNQLKKDSNAKEMLLNIKIQELKEEAIYNHNKLASQLAQNETKQALQESYLNENFEVYAGLSGSSGKYLVSSINPVIGGVYNVTDSNGHKLTTSLELSPIDRSANFIVSGSYKLLDGVYVEGSISRFQDFKYKDGMTTSFIGVVIGLD